VCDTMYFRLNEEPLFTLQILERLNENITSYGKEYFTLEKIERERQNILNGNPSKRCSESMICYEIYSDEDQHVGDITLTPQFNKEYEIDILIFEPNKGYGSTALNEFLSFYWNHFSSSLVAFVLYDNKNFDKMVSILMKRDFQLFQRYDNGQELKLSKNI
jgi:hypothetical protein